MVCVVLIAYGLIALNAGIKVSPWLGAKSATSTEVNSIMVQSSQGLDETTAQQAERVLPAWINWVAKLGSEQYAYSTDSILPTESHYLSMGHTKQAVLSTHMMSGFLIMVLGVFQFWPAFRRKHRTLHRIGGGLYVLAALVSLSMSARHLLTTSVEQIYSEWVFQMGLTILVLVASVALVIAGVAIFKRQIGIHLGWQAVAFGAFLTAPIQRVCWLLMAPMAGDSTFNEMNIIINVSLLAMAFLAAYLIFLMNRHASNLRPSATVPEASAKTGILLRTFGWSMLATGQGIVGFVYVAGHGLGQFEPTAQAMMPAAAQWHDGVVQGLSAQVFGLSTVVFVLAAAALAFGREAHFKQPALWWVLGVSGLVVCSIQLAWAWQLGRPDHSHSLGGAFYGFAGAMLASLSLWAIALRFSDRKELAVEVLRFALLMALAPALLWYQLIVGHASGFVPSQYTALGHGYQYAAAVGLSMPFVIGLVWAIHSEYTKRFAIN